MKNVATFLAALVLFVSTSGNAAYARSGINAGAFGDDTTSVEHVEVSRDCFTVEGNVVSEYYPEDGSDSPVTTGYTSQKLQIVDIGGNLLANFSTDSSGNYSHSRCAAMQNLYLEVLSPFKGNRIEIAYFDNAFEAYTSVEHESHDFLPVDVTHQIDHNWADDHSDITDSEMRAVMNAFHHTKVAQDKFSNPPLNYYSGANEKLKVHVGLESESTRFEERFGFTDHIYIDGDSNIHRR